MKAIWLVVCVAVALGVVGDAAAAQSFDNLLPDNTVFYLSLRDVPELLGKVKQTAGYKILTQLKLLERLAEPDTYAQFQHVYGTFIEPFDEIFSGEITLALVGMDDFEEHPQLVLLADVSEGKLALEEFIEGTIYPLLDKQGIVPEELTRGSVTCTKIVPDPDNPEDAIFFTVNDGVLMVTLRDDTLGEMLSYTGPGVARAMLPANAGYADVRRAVGDADIAMYVNLGAILAEALEEDDNREPVAWIGVLGFNKLRALGVGMAIGADGSGSSTLRLSTSGPPSGWLGMLARPAAPFKTVKRVPAEAGFYYAVNLGSLEELYNGIVGMVETVAEQSGQGAEEFGTGVEQLEALLAMDLEDEILPAFGGEIALAAKVPEAIGIPPAVLLIEIKDKATVERLVARIFELLESFGGETVRLTTTTHEGVEITTALVAPVITPGVAVLDDYLVVGTSAEAVRSVIDTQTEPSLETREDFRATMSPLPTSGTAMAYIDLKEVYEFAFPLVAAAAPRDGRIGELIKELGKLGEHLSGFGAVVTGDESGLTYRTHSKNALFEPMLAFGAGLFVPAVMSARQQAEMVSSMSNARQLAMAIQMYAVDHNDTLPTKLSDLVPDYVSGAAVFVHPTNGHKLKLIDLEKPETIDEHSDYELVLKGVKLSEIDDSSETVLLREKEPFLKNARVVVFVDGHCWQVPEGASATRDVEPDDE